MARPLSTLLIALFSLGLLSGCGVKGEPVARPTDLVVPPPSPTTYARPTSPPTWTPRAPTPTNTRVVPILPTFTPGPSPSPTRLPWRTKALVVGVQDAHVVEVLIENQPFDRVFVVRLLGVEPPPLSDPWAEPAFNWLSQEIGRQVVLLESDEMERDAQGNLLRYVWRGGRMVNVTMVQLGLASVADDVAGLAYNADLQSAQSAAQKAGRGIWGAPPSPTPTLVSVTPTISASQIATATLVGTQIPTSTLVSTPAP